MAPAVTLVGQMQGTGYADQPWLIERDGRFVQVSELLYRIAESADGERTLDEIADSVSRRAPWIVTGEQVGQLVASKLIPLGLMVGDEGPPSVAKKSPSVLQVGMRRRFLGPRMLDPVTKVLQILFAPPLLAPALLLIVAAHVWLYLVEGVERAVVELLYDPLLVLPLVLLVALSGVFHELGHASAMRYGGARARGVGVGFYLIYPVLYTDTTESYRLGRSARIRIDLGGFYFHLIFTLVLVAAALAAELPFLLVAVLAINLEIARQLLLPFVRFDGYWLLADLIGVPDPLSAFVPYMRRLLGRSGDKLTKLKPWVNRVFTVYLALAIPALLALLYLFATRVPRFAATAWDSLERQLQLLTAAADRSDVLGATLGALQVVLVALPLLGIGYVVYKLARLALSVAKFAIGTRSRTSTPASTAPLASSLTVQEDGR